MAKLRGRPVGLQAVILCGGVASRMLPLSERIPKSLFVVAGRPFIDWQLETLVAGGVTEVLLCTGHQGAPIRSHVGDGTRAGLVVAYSDDGETRLGTGGALRLAAQRGLLATRFVVQYGDSYLRIDHRALLATPGEAVMAVYYNQGSIEPSNCVVENEWVTHYQKGTKRLDAHWIDYGASAFDQAVVANAPADLAQLQSELAAQGRMRAFHAKDRFFEVGSSEGLAELEHHLKGLK